MSRSIFKPKSAKTYFCTLIAAFTILLLTSVPSYAFLKSFFSKSNNINNSFNRVPQLSPVSYIKKNIKSCYRWIGSEEFKTWDSGTPHFQQLSNDMLKRDGNNPNLIYCWSNTVGAMMGGYGEYYGGILVRIDFVDDAILYDRNQNRYYNIQDENTIIPENKKLGVDSEIIYAHYDRWFQEYIIKSSEAIKGWSFGDDQLQQTFFQEMSKLENYQLEYTDMHFFNAYCSKQAMSSNADLKEYCDKYSQIASDHKYDLSKYWRNNSMPKQYFFNSKARGN